MQLIYAHAHHRVIGKDGTMPWHLPEDLAHFRKLTQGAAVLMGRKTWQSLPAPFRPLPQRLNLVLSRRVSQVEEGSGAFAGAQLLPNLEQASQVAHRAQRALWVIGGGEVFALALPRAERIEVTEIDLSIEGADTFAPALEPQWHSEVGAWRTASSGLRYRFVTHRRQAASSHTGLMPAPRHPDSAPHGRLKDW